MSTMHQVVILTTHEISNETLRSLFNVVQRRGTEERPPNERWAGTAFKLADKVVLPFDPATGMPALGPQHIVPIYGPLSQ